MLNGWDLAPTLVSLSYLKTSVMKMQEKKNRLMERGRLGVGRKGWDKWRKHHRNIHCYLQNR